MSTYCTVDLASCRGDTQTCAICLEDYENNDLVYITQKCHHLFHSGCRESWRNHGGELKHTCPVCKQMDVKALSVFEIQNLEYVELLVNEQTRELMINVNPQKFELMLSRLPFLNQDQCRGLSVEICSKLQGLDFDMDALELSLSEVVSGFLEENNINLSEGEKDSLDLTIGSYLDRLSKELDRPLFLRSNNRLANMARSWFNSLSLIKQIAVGCLGAALLSYETYSLIQGVNEVLSFFD